MEQYFFKITSSYTDKNKLYAAFAKHARELDGTLIKDEQTLQAFIESLHKTLDNLHKKFSRCHQIPLQETDYLNTKGIRVPGSWGATFFKVHRAVELQDNFLQYYIQDNNTKSAGTHG